jgi:hypothetical protein
MRAGHAGQDAGARALSRFWALSMVVMRDVTRFHRLSPPKKRRCTLRAAPLSATPVKPRARPPFGCGARSRSPPYLPAHLAHPGEVILCHYVHLTMGRRVLCFSIVTTSRSTKTTGYHSTYHESRRAQARWSSALDERTTQSATASDNITGGTEKAFLESSCTERSNSVRPLTIRSVGLAAAPFRANVHPRNVSRACGGTPLIRTPLCALSYAVQSSKRPLPK